MTVPRSQNTQQRAVLTLLGVLMVSHLAFLGFRANEPNAFQRASETYVAILLALMTPLNVK
jgi:hypothetical protein